MSTTIFSVLSIIFFCVVLYISRTNAMLKGLWSEILNHFHYIYRSSTIVHALGRSMIDRKAPAGLPALANVIKVSDCTFCVLGLNPGTHTLQGTNTWLITGTKSSSHILVDTGEDVTASKYSHMLFNDVFPLTGTKRLSHILLTHGHGDHQGGVMLLLRELSKRNMLPLPKVYKRKIFPDGGSFPAKGFECLDIADNEEFSLEGEDDVVLQAMHTPGHTDDHVAFIFRRDDAILTGDCVLGCGTAVFDNLHDYMLSLDRLRSFIVNGEVASSGNGKITKIYPGHGSVISNALQKIDEYISHRNIRESQIVNVLTNRSRESAWVSSWELTTIVYGKLSIFVKFSAQWNLSHHLDKLLKEGRVQKKWPDMWRASPGR